jgi:hypothetical protein
MPPVNLQLNETWTQYAHQSSSQLLLWVFNLFKFQNHCVRCFCCDAITLQHFQSLSVKHTGPYECLHVDVTVQILWFTSGNLFAAVFYLAQFIMQMMFL